MGGRPFQANSQSAALSPVQRARLRAAVLGLAGRDGGAEAVRGGVRRLPAGPRRSACASPGALMCGLVFGFSLWSVSWVSWTTMSVWALLPWLCLLAELCVRRPGPLPFAGLAAVIGLQFLGGHPSSSFQVMVCGDARSGSCGRSSSRPLRERDLPLRLFTLGGGAGGRHRARGDHADPVRRAAVPLDRHQGAHGRRLGRARAGALPARDLPARLVGARVARAARVRLVARGARLLRGRPAADAGGLPRWCSPRGASGSSSPPLGAVALAVATGIPPFFTIVKSLPGFDAARNGRLAVIAVLCVAVLAGWGLDDLTGPARGGRAAQAAALAACGFLPSSRAFVGRRGASTPARSADGLRIAWGFATPAARRGRRSAWPRCWSGCCRRRWRCCCSGCGCAGGWACRPSRRWRSRLVVLDLFKAGMGYNPAIHERDAVQPVTPAIRYLQAQRPTRFAGLHPEAPDHAGRADPARTWRCATGSTTRAATTSRYEQRYAELWRRVIAAVAGLQLRVLPRVGGALAARAAGARAARRDRPAAEPRATRRCAGSGSAYAGPDARVYRNPAALPRAFLVDASRSSTAATRRATRSPRPTSRRGRRR